ncbi:MAG: A/G-specific adenine glycosylase [bacterium]
MEGKEFRKMLYDWYKKNGRHSLPWRQTTDPYSIFISELMLQQTQAPRVVPKYEAFLKKFPTAKVLARANTQTILQYWQGLGYNRRALFAQRACIEIQKTYKGIFPKSRDSLISLPGIGPYTARAICVFAYNQSELVIETNVRTVIIHHFLQNKENVADSEIETILKEIVDTKNPRKFYSAMMDYGTYLKGQGIKTHRKSTTYQKQSKFEGSFRQIRGQLVKAYASGGYKNVQKLIRLQEKVVKNDYKKALELLVKEGIVKIKN